MVGVSSGADLLKDLGDTSLYFDLIKSCPFFA